MNVACDQCGRQYQVDERMAGRPVKCKACGHQFTIPQATAAPVQDIFADMRIEGVTPTLPGRVTNPLANVVPGRSAPVAVEGPSDNYLRLLCAGSFAIGLVVLGLNHLTVVMYDTAYLAALTLGPFVLLFGIAGLINPNIFRAAGKYGKHLPIYYKLIAAAVGLAALGLCFLLVFVVYQFGQ